MVSRKLLILGVLAASLGGVAWFAFGTNTGEDEATVGFAAGDLETVPEPEADLEAAAPAANGEEDSFERTALEPGAPAAANRDQPKATLVVEGRVVNHGGAPVADAEVSLFLRRSLQALFREGAEQMRGPGGRQRFALQRVPRSVTTGRDGKFVFSGAAFEETTLEVGVKHERFAPEIARREWKAKDGKLVLEDIVLEVGGKVVGAVVDKAGAPLAEAEVRYTMDFEDMGRGGGRGGRGGRGGPGGPGQMMAMFDRTIEQLVPPVQTDARGAFELTNVPAGAFRVRAELPKRIPGSSPRLELQPEETKSAGSIVLELGAELHGVVRDPQGQPIAEAEVRANGSRAQIGDMIQNAIQNLGAQGNDPGGNQRGRMMEDARRQLGGMFGQERRTKTDAKGEFLLDGLPLGALRLEISHEKFCNESRDPVDPVKTPKVDLVLHPHLSVAGVLVDEQSSKPIELFGIKARRVPGDGGGRGPLGDLGIDRNAVRGAIEQVAGQVQGRRQAQAQPATGNEPQRPGRQGRGEQRQPQGAQADAEQAQREAQREARRLREETYRKERLGASGISPGPTPPASAHPEGRFVVDGLEPGNYVLDIDAPGYARIAAGPILLERDKPVPAMSLRLARGSNVSGRVVSLRGNDPIADARVELLLPPLEPEAGGAPRMQMPFGPGGQGPGGPGGPGRGGRGGGTRLGEARTGADGSFVITGLRPGAVQVRVTADGYVAGKPVDVVVPAGRDATGVVVSLGQGARLFGTVRNLKPGGTTVRAQHVEGDQATARAGEGGTYEMRGLRPGGWFVSIEGRGGDQDFARMIATQFARQQAGGQPDVMLVEGGETRFDLDAGVEELCTMRGTILKNGQPATDLEVSLQMPDAPGAASQAAAPGAMDLERMARRMSGRFLRDATDEKGAFQIANVPPGTYDVEIRPRRGGGGGRGGGPFGGGGGGSLLLRETIALAKGQTFARDYQISTAELRLEVVGADGKPVARGRVAVVLASEAGDRTPDKWNDLPSLRRLGLRDGAVRSEDILPGDYLYEVSSQGMKPATDNLRVASGSPASARVQMLPAEPEKK